MKGGTAPADALAGCFVRPGIQEVPQQLPALVFLHGLGQRGNDLSLVQQHGAPHYAAAGTLASPQPIRVIAPQCPLGVDWAAPVMTNRVIQLLATLRQASYVDSTRIYLTGWSMGGLGVCSVLYRMDDVTGIAAAAVVSGGFTEAGMPEAGARLARTPLFVAYGLHDRSVLAARSVAVIEILQAQNAAMEAVQYTDNIPNGVRPTAHVLACRHAFSTPHLYEWLLQHSSAPGGL